MTPPHRSVPAVQQLAALNQYLRHAKQEVARQRDGGTGLDMDGDTDAGMHSVRRFQQTWARISAETQVEQAMGRAAENAGPLNSHMLVLQSMASMRDLSPDYLRRFLSQVETLLWLDEEVKRRSAPARAKPARQPRKAR